ncbi:hypothetical protein HJG60_008941 [Phyllostomus discolor]|uniref:Uncharacterized protein n=1 Tax=Phyllostomus discolor TaxID=89673 RepID=A0A833YZC8_9CHIR|nr:hypothetical protein HJG60_008941 [Phyllostomus discolor]
MKGAFVQWCDNIAQHGEIKGFHQAEEEEELKITDSKTMPNICMKAGDAIPVPRHLISTSWAWVIGHRGSCHLPAGQPPKAPVQLKDARRSSQCRSRTRRMTFARSCDCISGEPVYLSGFSGDTEPTGDIRGGAQTPELSSGGRASCRTGFTC